MRRGSQKLAPIVAFVAFLSGCPQVRFVSEYDAVIDQKTTDLAAELVTFETRMERLAGTPAGSYAENVDVYDRMHGEIEAIKMRAAQHDKNQDTVDALGQLEANVERLRKLHEHEGDKGLREDLAKRDFSALEDQCARITKLELAKKQSDGESGHHQ